MYRRASRALDYLLTRPDWDGAAARSYREPSGADPSLTRSNGSFHEQPRDRRHHAVTRVAAAGPRWATRHPRPVDRRRPRRQVLHVRDRRGPADLGLRRWLDVAARGDVDERGAWRAPG